MPPFGHVFLHFRNYGLKHKHLYMLSFMFFFWSIFDGIVTYITPIVITGGGISKTTMGLIYGSSSVVGAVFDFILNKFFKNAKFRRLFLLMFALCLIHPLLLWQGKSLFIFLIAMAIWGIYWDLFGFGMYDFISRKLEPAEHASSFGVVDIFRSTGKIIAPIIAGLVIVEALDWKPFAIAWFFLGISFLIFLSLIMYLKRHHYEYIKNEEGKPRAISKDIKVWKMIFKKIWPIFLVLVFINIYDAFFWEIGPLFSEQFKQIHPLNGLFMSAYSLPILVVGWMIGGIKNKFGEKKSAYVALLGSSLILLLFGFLQHSPVILFIAVLVSSALITVTTIFGKGMVTEFIVGDPERESDIEALSDLSVNVGYVIGPITAGFVADKLGNMESFTVLGIIGIVCAVILFSSKKLHV